MREIASRAGFANGALKHYFSGKDQIIQGAYERSLTSLGERLLAHVGDARGIAALEMFMRFTLPIEQGDATAARVLLSFWERCAFSSELAGGYDAHLDSWKAGCLRYLAEGRADGEIRSPRSDEQLADEIIMMNIGATVIRVVSPDRLNAETLNGQVTDFIARLRRAE